MNFQRKKLFLILATIFVFGILKSQNTINDSQSGSTGPLRTLSFDKTDSVFVSVKKGEYVTFASYTKIRHDWSFRKTMQKQIDQDRVIRNKYPFKQDQFTAGNFLISGSTKKGGRSHLDNIPTENIRQKNDSTFVIYFDKHVKYDAELAKLNMTYYNQNHGGKVRKPYLEKQEDYLEPNTTYLFIVGISNAESQTLFDTYDKEITKDPKDTSLLETNKVLDKMKADEAKFLPPKVSFIANLSEIEGNYTKCLKAIYDDMRSIQDQIDFRNSSFIISHVALLNKSSLFPPLTRNLRTEQLMNLKNTGISRDSLTQLLNTVQEIDGIDNSYANKVNRGDIGLATLIPADDKNNNQKQSIIILEKLLRYIKTCVIERSLAGINPATVDEVTGLLYQWTVVLEDNMEDEKKMLKKKDTLNGEVKKMWDISSVNFNYAGTRLQDIQARGKLSIAPDFGAIAYGFLEGSKNRYFTGVSPYLGVQVNFRPFDQSVPFGNLPHDRKGIFNMTRFSGMMGVTLVSIKEEGKRDNLFSGTNLMLGAGYRLCTEIRIIAGTMLFKKKDTNYLSSQMNLAATEYAGISIDLNFKELFSSILGIFSPSK